MKGDYRLHPVDFRHGLINTGIALAILCVIGPLKFEVIDDTPITLQSLLVVLLPMVLGWVPGLLAVVAYLMLGAAGLPVFAGWSSGIDVFLGDTAGFLLAFPIAALLSGFAASRRYKLEMLALVVIVTGGQFFIVIAGLFWMEGVRQDGFDYGVQLSAFAPLLLLKSLAGMLICLAISRMRSPSTNAVK